MKKSVFIFLLLSCTFALAMEDHGFKFKDLFSHCLDARLQKLAQLPVTDQPIFIRHRPDIKGTDLIRAVYYNNDHDAIDALGAFFQEDPHPIFTREQLAQFLLNKKITGSTWRNHSSADCIITIGESEKDSLLMSIQHEITHVLHHAEIKQIGLKPFLLRQYALLEQLFPEACKDLCAKYTDYPQKLISFDALSEQEQYQITQVMLEYWADIEACCLLKDDFKTRAFVEKNAKSERPKEYLSYQLLLKIIQQEPAV